MAPDRPNVLFVLTDQQRWDTVGPHTPMDLTPNLDEMAAAGTAFDRTFSPQPLCAPARASLQTGQYATDHSVWKNDIALPDDERLLGRAFSRAGYDTGYVGKWHLSTAGTDPTPPDRRGGYDYWRAADVLEFTSHPDEGYVYDDEGERRSFESYRVDAMTEYARSFIRRDREAPFFCFLSYLEPHHQNDMEAYVAPEGYAERYANPWVPPDLEGVPGDWYESLPDYYGICRRIDECLGDLLATLEAEGVADETVVVFTSDHGSHFRTRNEEYKRSCHEAAIRVPAVATGPGFRDGGRVSELVSLLDWPPTLLSAAGIDVPDQMAGRDLHPLVSGVDDWREEVFVQVSESSLGRALRTDRWKYGVYDPDSEGTDVPANDTYRERYLYDLQADPYEQVNLVGHDDYREVADHLRERLTDRIEAVEDERPTIRRQPHQHY
ncbi:sulfatase-like hydrolase/transferase [Halorhabdus amylolytica]|uniref:sulfatase-like hydrolase/transferase n=1 Tax=Halorhabdus amylolytica TaxID=2559573 RepID=UPI0010AA9F17|nr:sulfatase-like hydrolase/transferase [Halorhabdus amylolytica]